MRDGGAETVAATGLVLDLLPEMPGSLRTAGIDYCHWRSSRRLEAAIGGLSNLDLLVAKGDRERVIELLRRQPRPLRRHRGYGGSRVAAHE